MNKDWGVNGVFAGIQHALLELIASALKMKKSKGQSVSLVIVIFSGVQRS